MKYPVVDRRALSGASVFGRPAAPPAPKAAPRRLGQAVQAALAITKAEYEKAEALYNRIQRSYPNLVSLLGDEKALQASYQAWDGMIRAHQAYIDSIEVSL